MDVEIWGFIILAGTTIATVVWFLGRQKEDLDDRIDRINVELVKLQSQSDLNKERSERIQDIFNLKINNLEENDKNHEKRIGNLRAQIDKFLTIRKDNQK